MVASPQSDASADRASAIRDGARELLERDGPDGLTIRRLVALLGVHPPAVYRHYADKRAVEAAVVEQAFREHGDVMQAAYAAHPEDPVVALLNAGRRWSLAHPHLYRLMYAHETEEAPPAPGIAIGEDGARVAGNALRVATDDDLVSSRAIWAFAHGHIMLELEQRFPADTDPEATWAFGIRALRAQITT